MTISFLVATTGRPTLKRALDSIELWPGDELIVVGNMGGFEDPRVRFLPHRPGKDWGHTERNYAMPFAKGEYLAHLDDDDAYVPGARALMERTADQPRRPVVFRLRDRTGHELWKDRQIRMGNVGTPMVIMPNVKAKLGRWAPRYGGDYDFLKSSRWRHEEYLWRPEVIVEIRPL